MKLHITKKWFQSRVKQEIGADPSDQSYCVTERELKLAKEEVERLESCTVDAELHRQIRAERDALRDALTEIGQPMRTDGTYTLDRPGCGTLARRVLGSANDRLEAQPHQKP
jgi:hypothetical protein